MDERGCRRDIRSNGWIDLSQEFALLENRSGRRNEFSSFGADLQDPQFHRRSLADVKSGPDVFADALVHRGTPWFPAGAQRPSYHFPNLRSSLFRTALVSPPEGCPALLAPASLVPMVIALPNGRVNRIARIGGNPSEIRIFANLRRQLARSVYAGFIAILKLPFKFDRS